MFKDQAETLYDPGKEPTVHRGNEGVSPKPSKRLLTSISRIYTH
jgi:hypothetical protein